MDLLEAGELGDAIDDFVYKEWEDGRKEEDLHNKELIEGTDDPQELISKYRNVVSPHARAEISVLFAYRNRFETLPELMKMYKELYFSGNESEMRCATGVLYSIYSPMRFVRHEIGCRRYVA